MESVGEIAELTSAVEAAVMMKRSKKQSLTEIDRMTYCINEGRKGQTTKAKLHQITVLSFLLWNMAVRAIMRLSMKERVKMIG